MSSTLQSQQQPVLWQSSYMISDGTFSVQLMQAAQLTSPVPEKSASTEPPPSLQPSAAPTRRLSWIHNISQKFSTNSSTPVTESALGEANNPRRISVDKRGPQSLKTEQKNNTTDSASAVIPSPVLPVDPVEPKSGFFSALRRLSTSRGSGPSAECRRVIFNKNTNRPVCPVNELRCVKMKRVAFKVDEIDDEIITREPLYSQIRRAIKSQEAMLQRKRHAIASAVANHSGSSLDERAAIAGLDGSRTVSCRAKPCVPDKGILFLDGPVEIPKGVMSKIRNASLSSTDESDDGCRSSAASTQSCDSDRRPSVASTASTSSDETGITFASSVPTPDLGCVYIRCCKLRELRPLDFFYDQVKGLTESVESLRLCANGGDPPIFAQVQTLADFLAFVPVENFHMDNVVLADDMVKALMASLLWSKSLKSLTMSNTKLNAAGWKSVCYLVAMNKSLKKVDLSGVRRKNSEWAVLSKAVEARGADNRIELVLIDADIPPAEMERVKA
ncbi:hypothetical protein V1520DRAFT_346613 [Lipomyces starkeyi]|uniref:Uncharacterized protein n=1 Tax=Lipomyces starkeyi NRRL Y-11557 TaxID=675824 RepID=A0A1E3QBP2_LIPST|nr:hypothetical protein LIPSTDRAFT_69296 [Lipomyces starkeyi NRRL Y-11557]